MPKKKLVLNGIVISGNKKGREFVNLAWVNKQIKEKMNFNAFLGTLNLRVQDKPVMNKLRELEGITIIPKEGYCRGKCLKACINKKIEGAVVVPDVSYYPNDVFEVLAPVNLRKTLGLMDGDEIEVTILVK